MRVVAVMMTAVSFIKIRRLDPLSSELRRLFGNARHRHENSLGSIKYQKCRYYGGGRSTQPSNEYKHELNICST